MMTEKRDLAVEAAVAECEWRLYEAARLGLLADDAFVDERFFEVTIGGVGGAPHKVTYKLTVALKRMG
jgi:hypothetical protein